MDTPKSKCGLDWTERVSNELVLFVDDKGYEISREDVLALQSVLQCQLQKGKTYLILDREKCFKLLVDYVGYRKMINYPVLKAKFTYGAYWVEEELCLYRWIQGKQFDHVTYVSIMDKKLQKKYLEITEYKEGGIKFVRFDEEMWLKLINALGIKPADYYYDVKHKQINEEIKEILKPKFLFDDMGGNK